MADVRKFAVGDMVEVPSQPCPCCPPMDSRRLARVTSFAEDDPEYDVEDLYLGDPPYYMIELVDVVRLPNESVMAESWMRPVAVKLSPTAIRAQPRRAKPRAARRGNR